jgi:hypothetical protein
MLYPAVPLSYRSPIPTCWARNFPIGFDEQPPAVLEALVEFGREWHRTGRGPKHRDGVRYLLLEYVEQRLAEAKKREQRLLEGITGP